MQSAPFVGLPREARAPRLHLTARVRREVDNGMRRVGHRLRWRSHRVRERGQALLEALGHRHAPCPCRGEPEVLSVMLERSDRRGE
jgi:hypothetical protein